MESESPPTVMITSGPNPIFELFDAFRRSKTMFAAESLGIFESLAGKSKTVEMLAQELSLNADALTRLLDALVAMNLLNAAEGTYTNAPVANEYLVRTSPRSMNGYVRYSNDILFRLWANLEDAVREGTHRWPQAFNLEGPIFSSFFKTDDAMRTFLKGMHGFGMVASPKVVEAFDLSPYRTFCDLGGATGHLVSAACDRYPKLQGILFELAKVIPFAMEYPHARVKLHAGDFFTDPLPPADLYALGRIVHDWNEEKIYFLLMKIHAALPDGGALLIAEKILYDDKQGPLPANLQSLNMLICTEGKERSLPEYRRLLTTAGFSSVEGRGTGAPVDAILAVK
jgi:acetylserotonin N-methyltransferase